MEWYRKADGEVVFGEIGARPPGARVVDLMNYATDGDLYVGWAEAVVHGHACSRSSAGTTPAASSSAPAARAGSPHIEGLDALLAGTASTSCCVDLLPVGAPRRDWRTDDHRRRR